MNGLESHQAAAMPAKRPWDDKASSYLSAAAGSPFYQRVAGGGASALMPVLPPPARRTSGRKLLGLSALDDVDDVASAVVPPVTVALEGRSICHRIHLDKHTGYDSLAKDLRRLFVDADDADGPVKKGIEGLDLTNAVPGHMVAYEDMEDDLLLAGDLSWKDFVRVAKRIRIIPTKASRRKHCGSA